MSRDPHPLKLVIAALGGQGGGVVSEWLVQVAKLENFIAQTTSVPGVAQRTGATIYYVEFFPRDALPGDGRAPVLALMPHPGDVDVVVASELMEAGRAVLRGLVTRDRTTLIASSHRVYAISEKSLLGDGRANETEVVEVARKSAKRLLLCDMKSIADTHNSVISAVMLGALAGSRALPFSLESYRKAIVMGSIAVKQSLAAFDAAVLATAAAQDTEKARLDQPESERTSLPSALHAPIQRLPERVRPIATQGVQRLVDYQDRTYADDYLRRLEGVLRLNPLTPEQETLVCTVARCLAVWMSFEDTIRVADLKIRAVRTSRVLTEVAPGSGQIVEISEFMKPRLQEICGTLPAGLGRWILRSRRTSKFLSRFTKGRRVRTSRVSGFVLLYALASLRVFRRHTLRFIEEDARIRAWLDLVGEVSRGDCALATEVAECQTLVKGYGGTLERGWQNFQTITARAREMLGKPLAAERLRKLRTAALADEDGDALRRALL